MHKMAWCLSGLLLAVFFSPAAAHTVLTYPAWRGDTLHTSGSAPEQNPNTIGVDYVNGTYQFPYGQEWIYPCGGLPLTTNRTKWPVSGGAVAFQPGWFQGHSIAFIYINVGITGPGELAPPNMSHNVVPPFELVGPSNEAYNATVCLPQVPLPANVSLQVGDNITIQVVESAQHGAALYNCADVTLVEPEDADPVDGSTCFNSSNLEFRLLFTASSITSASPATNTPSAVGCLLTMLMVSSAILFI